MTLVKDDGDSAWVVVCCRKYLCIDGRPVKPARLLFDTHGMYCFEVLLKKIKVGCWMESLPPHREIGDYLETFLKHSGYIICPGLVNFETEFGVTVRFKPKHLRVWSNPITRYDSEECSLWLRPSNHHLPDQSPLINTCSNCRLLHRSLTAIKKRALETSPHHREKWTEPTSNRPFKYLSPTSQVKRVMKSSEQRRCVCLFTLLQYYQHNYYACKYICYNIILLLKVRRSLLQTEDIEAHDVELEAGQDNQLQCLIREIEENGQSELEGIFRKADESGEGVGDQLRQIWERDVTSRKEFFEDQLKNSKLSS